MYMERLIFRSFLKPAFPKQAFTCQRLGVSSYGKDYPKPFPHHRERGLGSVEKGLVPSLLSPKNPLPPTHPTWGKARFGEITKPFHMETKRGNGE
jgi:hypothetical protein